VLAYGWTAQVGDDAHAGLWTSHDGVAWTALGSRPDADAVTRIVRGDGRFVALGRRKSRDLLFTSTDGARWDEIPRIAGSLQGVASSGRRFVAVGDRPDFIFSTDGLRWRRGSVRGETADVGPQTVAWMGDRYIAVGRGPRSTLMTADWTAWESADGRTWREIEGHPMSEEVFHLRVLIGLPERAIVTGSTLPDQLEAWSVTPVDP
jgi:hypothetical protein